MIQPSYTLLHLTSSTLQLHHTNQGNLACASHKNYPCYKGEWLLFQDPPRSSITPTITSLRYNASCSKGTLLPLYMVRWGYWSIIIHGPSPQVNPRISWKQISKWIITLRLKVTCWNRVCSIPMMMHTPSLGVHVSSYPLIEMAYLPIMDPQLKHSSWTYVQGAFHFPRAPRSTSRLVIPNVPTTNPPQQMNHCIRCQTATCLLTITTFKSMCP